MRPKGWQKEKRERLRRLRDLGVPVEISEDNEDRNFIIRQQGGFLENCAFGLSCGGTGFIISLCITMNKPKLLIADFELEVYWQDSTLRWLDDPRETGAPMEIYQFPGGPEFSRDLVINHVTNRNRPWSAGHSVKGLLLGVGLRVIPTDSRHGESSPAILRVVDQFGITCLCPIELWIDRSANLSTPLRKKLRRGLSEHADVDA